MPNCPGLRIYTLCMLYGMFHVLFGSVDKGQIEVDSFAIMQRAVNLQSMSSAVPLEPSGVHHCPWLCYAF